MRIGPYNDNGNDMVLISLLKVFEEEEEVLEPLSREKFREIVAMSSKGAATAEDADRIFDHYKRMPVLLLEL